VDEHLAQHHSDLLFSLRLKTGDPALAYLLLEHKSSPDVGTPLQLLRYIVRILTKCYDERRRLPLPVVLPLVAHHGPEEWTFSTAFIDLFGNVPDSVRPFLVSFRHALVDLPRIHDGALSADSRGEEIMGHFSQEFEARGRAIGTIIGEAKGRTEGKADALLRVLEKRFGAVPSRLRERIATADVASLDAWSDRALDVSDLNSVFESSEVA
jgi:predicted transposase YdaD